MKNFLKRMLVNQLAKKNRSIQRLTAKESIISLLEKLHPYHFDDLIRMGPNGDGGYLVPNDLNGIQACFSPGVGKISGFERCCFNKGMEIYLADKSVDKVNLDIPKEKYGFLKKNIASTNNEDFMTLDEWVSSTIATKNSDLLLQMDIEGGEYDVIMNISNSLMRRFRILLIEFHFLEKLWNPEFFHFAEIVFNKILQTHSCIHIHPNNCCGVLSLKGIEIPRVMEFSFLRKDRLKSFNYENKFPHKLDSDNTDKEHIMLTKNWYKGI